MRNTRQINRNYHFIRELVTDFEIVDMVKVTTDEQQADIFTKALGRSKIDAVKHHLFNDLEDRTSRKAAIKEKMREKKRLKNRKKRQKDRKKVNVYHDELVNFRSVKQIIQFKKNNKKQ